MHSSDNNECLWIVFFVVNLSFSFFFFLLASLLHLVENFSISLITYLAYDICFLAANVNFLIEFINQSCLVQKPTSIYIFFALHDPRFLSFFSSCLLSLPFLPEKAQQMSRLSSHDQRNFSFTLSLPFQMWSFWQRASKKSVLISLIRADTL